MNNILCDNCKKELNYSFGIAKYRLNLSCNHLPHDGGHVIDVFIYPTLDRDFHFCGLECLKNWLDGYIT